MRFNRTLVIPNQPHSTQLCVFFPNAFTIYWNKHSEDYLRCDQNSNQSSTVWMCTTFVAKFLKAKRKDAQMGTISVEPDSLGKKNLIKSQSYPLHETQEVCISGNLNPSLENIWKKKYIYIFRYFDINIDKRFDHGRDRHTLRWGTDLSQTEEVRALH